MPTPNTLTDFVEMTRREWKHPPNLVTAIRMVGALGLPPLILSPQQRRRLAGLLLFVALAGTDKLDGWMAKRIFGSTDLGKMLDPIVDKELIGITLVSVMVDARRRQQYGMFAVLLVAAIVLTIRELAVAGIKLRAQQRDNKIESAIQSGRVSMTLQSVALGALLVPVDTPAVRKGKFALLAAAVVSSLYSWREYYRRYEANA